MAARRLGLIAISWLALGCLALGAIVLRHPSLKDVPDRTAAIGGPMRAAAAAKGGNPADVDGFTTVAGRVLDPAGHPLAGAKVVVVARPKGARTGAFKRKDPAPSVTIEGLSIVDGLATIGGGLLDEGGSLTLVRDTLTADQAMGMTPGQAGQGGGVAVTGAGSLTVQDCTFLADVAEGAEGATGGSGTANGLGGNGEGGAIFADAGTTLSVSGSGFFGDQAIGGMGGVGGMGGLRARNGYGGRGDGGAIETDAASFTVRSSTFIQDIAQGGTGAAVEAPAGSSNGFGGAGIGGAIDIESSVGTFQVDGSVFLGDTALGGAGADGPTAGSNGQGGFSLGGAISNSATATLIVKSGTFDADLAQGARAVPSSRAVMGSPAGARPGAASLPTAC